jgi:hypothetical protein
VVAAVVVGALLPAGCSRQHWYRGGGGSAGPPVTHPMPSTTAPPGTTPPAGPGAPGPGCVNGWTTPAPGTALRAQALDILRRGMNVTGELRVVDMRYFTGPEVPWIIAPRPPLVGWWYVKAQLVDDPTLQARWLIAKRSAAVEGIAAVARFDTGEDGEKPGLPDENPHCLDGT